MNKWMKQGVTGLIVGAAALASAGVEQKDKKASELQLVSVDSTDSMGGSKLKDRMIVSQEEEMTVVYALINS